MLDFLLKDQVLEGWLRKQIDQDSCALGIDVHVLLFFQYFGQWVEDKIMENVTEL